MFVRQGKKRTSLQLAANTVTRARKLHRTCLVLEDEEEEMRKKKELEVLATEFKEMLLESLELRIDEFERWSRDKQNITRGTWALLDLHIEPIVVSQPRLCPDEQPECPAQKFVWRKLPLYTTSNKRLTMNAITDLTKQSFYHWGREQIQNMDSLVPLDMSLELPARTGYDNQDCQLSELRRNYLQQLKNHDEYASSVKKHTMAEASSLDGKAQLRQKTVAKDYTYDYNGSKIYQERKKETIVQPPPAEPTQYEIKEGPAVQTRAMKVEKFQSKVEEEKCRNIVNEKKLKGRRASEEVLPNRLENGVSIYSQTSKQTQKGKQKTTAINNSTVSQTDYRQSIVKPKKQPLQPRISEISPAPKQEPSARGRELAPHKTERTVKQSPSEHRDRILLNSKKDISKENIQSLFKVTLSQMTTPIQLRPSKFIEDLAPTIKLPRLH